MEQEDTETWLAMGDGDVSGDKDREDTQASDMHGVLAFPCPGRTCIKGREVLNWSPMTRKRLYIDVTSIHHAIVGYPVGLELEAGVLKCETPPRKLKMKLGYEP